MACDAEKQRIHEQILQLNPAFNPHDWYKPGNESRDARGPSIARREVLGALEKRKKVSPGGMICEDSRSIF